MRTSDFDFALPGELVAQYPLEQRDESRLMVVDRATGTITHHHFSDLRTLIPPRDLLVLNTTRVVRARLLGTRASGAPAEVLLLKRLGGQAWEAMVRPSGKVRAGQEILIAPGFSVVVQDATDRGTRLVNVVADDVDAAIEQHGHIPLPPYIARGDTAADADRYQTVYAQQNGSAAAPTAGLHFTPELLAALREKGVLRTDIVLHVGAGTFKPVTVDDISGHVMHEEWYSVSQETAAAVNAARRAGQKVWAVGTTTLRALESATGADGLVHEAAGETRLFVHPPYTIRSADRLITNFHLPRSTLLMLVAAFAGLELTRHAYALAVQERYRFYSYGDAMVIL